MKLEIFLTYLFLIFPISLTGQVKVVKESTSTIDAQALSINGKFGTAINGKTFQKDAITSHQGYQYLAYYDQERHVCIARRKLPKGQWQTIRFLDYYFKSDDSHNVISMGICPNDGTIHLAWDHHVDNLHYRVSKKGLANQPENMDWSTASFGPIQSELEKGKAIKITYPKFWQTPEGDLQFNYRIRGSGNGDRMLVDYHADTGLWTNTRQIDSSEGLFEDEMGPSTSRCSYPNGYDYDSKGNLHATWVWRESSQGANHDLIYVYSEDHGRTWKNNQGTALKELPHVNSEGVVVQSIPRKLGLMNDHGQAIDSKDQIHVVMYHCTEATLQAAGVKPGALRFGPAEAKRYHHYWRDNKGEWHHFEMDWPVGNRPKIFTDSNDNLIMIFAGASRGNENKKNKRLSKRALFIAVATAKNQWQDWKIVHQEKGPFFNEMQGDLYRWKSEGILSIMVQETPKGIRKPSALKVVDFSFQF
ncbi:MAG: BNR repeat-containing protein [Saprospiraceae bacterium]